MHRLLDSVFTSGLKILVPSTLEETYKVIVEEALRLMDAESGNILIGNGNELVQVYSTSEKVMNVKPRRRGYSYQVYKSGKAMVLNQEQIGQVHPEIRDIPTNIIVPIFYNGESTGVLHLQTSHPPESINEPKLQALQLFGAMASLAIRKIQSQEEVRRALETRDLFISMAAHELRTPLTVIKLYVQMLRKKYNKQNRPEKDWISNLNKETDRLIHLVNELLHVDQIRTGSLKFSEEKYSLRSILLDAIATSQLNHEDHVFLFLDKVADISDIVTVDINKLFQAFVNILNNSAKFSPAGSVIQTSLQNVDGKFQVSIQDHGKGIPTQELDKVFEAFYKGRHNQTQEGMGLGLSLVKLIVEQSRGSIEIDSKENKGTTVTVRLPREKK